MHGNAEGDYQANGVGSLSQRSENGVIAISLDENDELAWVHLTSGEDDLWLQRGRECPSASMKQMHGRSAERPVV